MPYRKSIYRIEFDARIASLISESERAQKFGPPLHALRDMTFQCAIFQTSAAIEIYLKLVVESWFQQLKVHGLGSHMPKAIRARFAAFYLIPKFQNYLLNGDEASIYKYLAQRDDLWNIMVGGKVIPPYLTGRELHEGSAYPSSKNIKRLFIRLGIPTIHSDVEKILKRDVDTMIDGFQSLRTAIAHSAPPSITEEDVRRLLSDMKNLVRALDRIIYKHIMKHGGDVCWK